MIKKNKKLAIFFIVSVIVVSVVLIGCGKPMEKIEKSYSSSEINKIDIITNANDIYLTGKETENVTINFIGAKKELSTLNNGVLTIDIHETLAGITTSPIEPLYIEIPQNQISSISLKSDAGNIKIDNVSVSDLIAVTEVGNITAIGLNGKIKAETTVGTIETTLPIGTEIIDGKDGLGNILNIENDSGDNDDNSECNSNLYTNTGVITLE